MQGKYQKRHIKRKDYTDINSFIMLPFHTRERAKILRLLLLLLPSSRLRSPDRPEYMPMNLIKLPEEALTIVPCFVLIGILG